MRYLEGTRIEDLRGMKFGRLTVIDFDWGKYKNDKIRRKNGEIKGLPTYWICRCDCGNAKSHSRNGLVNGDSKSCGCYSREKTSIVKSKPKTLSFEQWCLDNNHQDYLDLWDYELNDKKPSEVSYRSNRKIWFKCQNGIHDSEQWCISNVVSIKPNGKQNTSISCRRCNSIGKYLEDNGLCDIWSGKNETSQFDINKGSEHKIILKCADCGGEKSIRPHEFVKYGLRCGCGDGQSYPNKFITCFLNQLNIEFEQEKYVVYNDKRKRYDHYIPSVDCIIENHGKQHYETKFCTDVRIVRKNDVEKKFISKCIGVTNYVELDCRESNLDWIKRSILESELINLLNISETDVDWDMCDCFATKNLVKEVCLEWETGRYVNTKEIGNVFNLTHATIGSYLKKGREFGWCRYDPDEERRKGRERYLDEHIKKMSKMVKILHNGETLGVFNSIVELERASEKLFGVKLNHSNISAVCKGKKKKYKGYVFKYIDN